MRAGRVEKSLRNDLMNKEGKVYKGVVREGQQSEGQQRLVKF